MFQYASFKYKGILWELCIARFFVQLTSNSNLTLMDSWSQCLRQPLNEVLLKVPSCLCLCSLVCTFYKRPSQQEIQLYKGCSAYTGHIKTYVSPSLVWNGQTLHVFLYVGKSCKPLKHISFENVMIMFQWLKCLCIIF